MILEVDNIELSFSDKTILNGIYIKAETGKITSILGSNGSGKSCLFQVIFGSLKSKYKLVRINHKPLLQPAFQNKRIGFLPQYHLAPKHIKVFGLFQLFGVDWKPFVKTFPELSKHRAKSIRLLSGGERRLIETYIIIKGHHEIILLDEPFSHLSPIYIEHVKALIQNKKHDKVILITDHMYKHIVDISDDIYLLKDGHTNLIKDLKDLEFFNYLNAGSLDH